MKERIYQRLLAGDQDKAVELFDECVQETSIVDTYDTILVPILARAEINWQLGELKDEKHKFILQSLRDIIQYRGERFKDLAAKAVDAKTDSSGIGDVIKGLERQPKVTIFCIPARTEADEVTALMMAQLLEEEGRIAQAFPASIPTSEVVELVGQVEHAVICIAATPPTAIMHSRSLARRLYDKVPNMPLIVGLWDSDRDLVNATERIGCKVTVVGSIADAIAEIRSLPMTHHPS